MMIDARVYHVGLWVQPEDCDTLLFDLSSNSAETIDIDENHPEIKAELIDEWRRYAARIGGGIAEANPN